MREVLDALLVDPATTAADVRAACAAALAHGIRGVVVREEHAELALQEVGGSLDVTVVEAVVAEADAVAVTPARLSSVTMPAARAGIRIIATVHPGAVDTAAGTGADEVQVWLDDPDPAAVEDALTAGAASVACAAWVTLLSGSRS